MKDEIKCLEIWKEDTLWDDNVDFLFLIENSCFFTSIKKYVTPKTNIFDSPPFV